MAVVSEWEHPRHCHLKSMTHGSMNDCTMHRLPKLPSFWNLKTKKNIFCSAVRYIIGVFIMYLKPLQSIVFCNWGTVNIYSTYIIWVANSTDNLVRQSLSQLPPIPITSVLENFHPHFSDVWKISSHTRIFFIWSASGWGGHIETLWNEYLVITVVRHQCTDCVYTSMRGLELFW